jgi:HD-GYP domain-containing protein (c-di-GMP phosphodiesterase class II)
MSGGNGGSTADKAARLEKLLTLHRGIADSGSFEELGRRLQGALSDLIPPFCLTRFPVEEKMVGREFPLAGEELPLTDVEEALLGELKQELAEKSLAQAEAEAPFLVRSSDVDEAIPRLRERVDRWFLLPLTGGDGSITEVLMFEFRESGDDYEFLTETVTHLREILSPVVQTIKLRRDYQEMQRDSEALMKVSTIVSGKLHLKELLTELARQCSWLLDADRSTVWLYDDETEEIFTFVGEGLANEIRMPVGLGIAGAVAETKDTLNIGDPYSHPLFNPEVDRETGYLTKSILCMPLLNKKDELIGVYQVLNKLDFDRFTTADEQMLAALSGSASVAIENAILYEDQKKQFNSFIEVLATSVDAKDPTTADHSKMVTGVAVALAKEMGFAPQRVEFIRVAGVLHDYGKIAIPDAILMKPGQLTPEEFKVMWAHAERTIEILGMVYFTKEMRDVPRIAGMHHERLDGSGYPYNLKAEEIPLEGRILAVADIFHAMMQERPYKRGKTPSEALAECKKLTKPHIGRFGDEEGAWLDGEVVVALETILEREHYNAGYFADESGWSDISAKEISDLQQRSLEDLDSREEPQTND